MFIDTTVERPNPHQTWEQLNSLAEEHEQVFGHSWIHLFTVGSIKQYYLINPRDVIIKKHNESKSTVPKTS